MKRWNNKAKRAVFEALEQFGAPPKPSSETVWVTYSSGAALTRRQWSHQVQQQVTQRSFFHARMVSNNTKQSR